jgi:hypothetical protein
VDVRVDALRAGVFDVAGWTERQATTGRLVSLGDDDVSGGTPVRAVGVDARTGALVIEDPSAPRGERHVHAGEVTRVRLAPEQV